LTYFFEGEQVEDFLMDLGHLMGATDFVTDVHLVYQDNKSTMAMVTTGGGKPRTKYIKVREEYLRKRLKTWEVVLEYISIKQMLADSLTKPLGGEMYHTMTQKLLGGHHYECLNNMGAKGKLDIQMSDSVSIDGIAPVLALLTCSNHTLVQPSKKHGTKCVLNESAKHKQHIS
jgi:hypothetical protein